MAPELSDPLHQFYGTEGVCVCVCVHEHERTYDRDIIHLNSLLCAGWDPYWDVIKE